jgi:GT2 family glycosyltransferase
MAIPQFEGDLIVFADDDVAPATDWLRRLRDAADAHPGFAVFGGRILPRWPSTPPDWLLQEAPLEMAYALTSADWREGPIVADWIFGPNMSVRTELFDHGMRFNEAVGPASGDYIMGSETEFTLRACTNGFRCWHVPDAVVEHLIRPHQLDPDWIIRRGFRFGRSQGRNRWLKYQAEGLNDLPKLLSQFRWPVRRFVKSSMMAFYFRLTGQKRYWFRHAYVSCYAKGLMAEFYALSRESRNSG